MDYPRNTQIPFNVASCELKAHNVKAYKEAVEQIELYGRSAIVQPTGTGKSYVMMQIMQDFSDELKVVLGSSKGALRELECKTEWVEHNSIVYTYSNSHNLVSMLEQYGKPKVKLIVLDELHRVGAAVWGNNVQQLLEMYPEAAVLGLTATPIRFLDSKRDMVSEMFNGISAGNLTLQQAIESGILPAPIYVTAMFDISEDVKNRLAKINTRAKPKGKKSVEITEVQADTAKKLIEDYTTAWSRDEGIVRILREHIGSFTDKNYKHIIFVPTIELADNMRTIAFNWFKQVYPNQQVNVYVVHSSNTSKNYELEDFCTMKTDGNIDIMIAVNMANEGFHIDNTKSVMMLRYTNSPNIYLQQIGRALASGGENPIIFDFIGNIDAIGNITAFLNTMETKVSSVLKDQVHEQVRQSASKLFKRYEDHTSDFRELINTVDRMVSNKWDTNMYALLDIYNSNPGLVDMEYIEDKALVKWAREQQKAFIEKTLTAEKQEQFKQLGRLAYTTQTMVYYGVAWLELVEDMKARKQVDSTMESALKYKLYCNRLPVELIEYIRDTELDLDLNEQWFRDTCNKYNRKTTDRFYEIINTIMNNDQIRIHSDTFDIETYVGTVTSILSLSGLFEKYKDREDSPQAVLMNLMGRYWRIHSSQIASRIEIDIGTLENHRIICKSILGEQLSEEEGNRLKFSVYDVQKELRASSTNALLNKLNPSL